MSTLFDDFPDVLGHGIHFIVQGLHAGQVFSGSGVKFVAFNMFRQQAHWAFFDEVPQAVDQIKAVVGGVGDEVRFKDIKR